MQIKIASTLSDIAIVLMFIGFGFHSVVHLRRKIRNKGGYTPLFKDLTIADKKLMIIGAIIALLGFLIIVTLRMVVGPTIYLGCG